MPQAKTPQDRKPKGEVDPDSVFTFTHKGKRYSFSRPTAEVITPGWLRRNRKVEETDAQYTAIEQLADEDVLDVLDNMTWAEHGKFHEDFGNHMQEVMGVSLGEATAS